MSTFVHTENIRRFRLLLEENLEPARRRMVEGLLADEEAKLAALGDDAKTQAIPERR